MSVIYVCLFLNLKIVYEPYVNMLKTESTHRQWKLQKLLSPSLRTSNHHRTKAMNILIPYYSPGGKPVMRKTLHVKIHEDSP